MKKIIFLFSATCSFIAMQAQSIAVNTNGVAPDASSVLDISSASKGLLIPRMSSAGITSITNPAKGLLVYDSSKNQLMVNMGTPSTPAWQTIVYKSGWNVAGNNGLDPATTFVGNTDNKPLSFRVNNNRVGMLDEYNVAWGNQALASNQGLNNNIAIGRDVMFNNQTGYSNVAIGARALMASVDKSNLVAIGDSALFKNGTGSTNSYEGSWNTAVGSKSLYSNTLGYANTGIGYYSLYANTTGVQNTAIGLGALQNNITGSNNTAIGPYAAYQLYGGGNNTAIGEQALSSTLYANDNTALGFFSLGLNTVGNSNVGVGSYAAVNNQTGYSNVALGAYSLYYNNYQSNTVAIGDSSLYFNGYNTSGPTDGQNNTAVGSKAMYSNIAGYSNTALGYHALFGNNGNNNTAMGHLSMQANLTGSNNTAVGAGASCGTNLTNATAIGYAATAASSNSIQLGNASITNVNTYGNITVQNGKGMIRSNDGTQQKKVTTIVTVNSSIATNATINIPFSFSETFSSAPDVYVGNVTGGAGGFAEVVMVVSGVTTGGATLFVHNPHPYTWNPSFTVKIIAIGPQ